jgi:Helix-turn-helix domain
MRSANTDQPIRPLEGEALAPSFSVRQLAKRWRTSPKRVRQMIKRGTLSAFDIGNKRKALRIPPEAVRAAEQGALAVRPKAKARRREQIDAAIVALLAD